MKLNRFARTLVSGMAALVASPAFATDLFNTGFEDDDYALGTLVPQEGWIAFRNANIPATQVTVPGAQSGAQGVTLDGALMELYPTGLYRGYYYPPINYDLTGTGNTTIEFSCDVALFIDPADTSLDVAWRTEFYQGSDPFARYGAVGLESYGDGNVEMYMFNDIGEILVLPYTPGTWVHIVARMNFATGMISASFDGVDVGELAFDTSNPVFGDADLVLICDQEFSSFAYVDNYRIVATGGSNPCPCPGDFNNDNAVGLSDLTLFLASFGGAPGNPCMDANGDNTIGLSDLTAFLSVFGTTCP